MLLGPRPACICHAACPDTSFHETSLSPQTFIHGHFPTEEAKLTGFPCRALTPLPCAPTPPHLPLSAAAIRSPSASHEHARPLLGTIYEHLVRDGSFLRTYHVLRPENANPSEM